MRVIFRFLFYIFLVLLTVFSFWVALSLTPWGLKIFSPMHFAVKNKITTLVYFLSFTPLKNHTFSPPKEIMCQSPLTLASRWGSKDMIGILLDQGADPELCGSIWYHARGKPEVIRFLIEERKILDSRPQYESKAFSMLDCSQSPGNEWAQKTAESLRVFMKNGADPNMTRHDTFLGMDISLLTEAKRSGCTLHSALLREYGAHEEAAEAAYQEIKKEIKHRKALSRSKAAVRGVSAEFTRKENQRRKAYKRARKAARGLAWELKRDYKNPLARQK